MAKAIKIQTPKEKAKNYEPKLKFDGIFEEMISISTTGAGAKPKKISNKKK